MIDVEDVLRAELERLVHVDAEPDWDAIVSGSGLRHERARRRRRLAAGATLVLAAALLGLTTPLGTALARSLSGFSAWLTGQPGTRASEGEQRAFNRANARSWVGFPTGTELRHLISRKVDGVRVELLGFRAGTSAFCLRIVVQGKSRTTTQSCASLADLRLAGSPVRVVIVDQPFGKGTKTAWYGIDRLRSANLQITAGIAADSVRSVIVRDDQGDHRVAAVSNAFLYVARHPDVGQRVTAVSARTRAGLVSVPFARSPFGFGASQGRQPAPPVVRVQRHVSGGRIGWLERRDRRGQPLSVLPARLRRMLLGYRGGVAGRTRVVFGRVVTPDPSLPLRIAVTLNAHHAGGAVAGICTAVVTGSGGGGGCSPYPAIFAKEPVSVGSMGNGPDGYVTAEGIASDAVDHIQVLFSNGQRLRVALVDNAFVIDLARTKLPARIVAYDDHGLIVGASDPIQDFGTLGRGGSPARGRAGRLLSAVGSGGAHSELLVGPSTTGGECMYVRHYFSARESGATEGCMGRRWSGPALQLGTDGAPTRFVYGRARSDVTTIRLRYADGSSTTVVPTRGYVLQAMTAPHLERGHELVAADGLTRDGRVIAHESFRLPKLRAAP